MVIHYMNLQTQALCMKFVQDNINYDTLNPRLEFPTSSVTNWEVKLFIHVNVIYISIAHKVICLIKIQI